LIGLHQILFERQWKRGELAGAMNHLDWLVSTTKEAHWYSARGKALASQEKFAAARADLDEALRLQPEDIETLAARATLLNALNENAAGLLDANKALLLAEAGYQNTLSTQREAERQRQTWMMPHYDQLLNQQLQILVQLYLVKAQLQGSLQQWQNGLETTEKGLKYRHREEELVTYKMEFLVQLNRRQEAETLLDDLVKRQPTKGWRLLRARYREQQNDLAGAFEDYQTEISKKAFPTKNDAAMLDSASRVALRLEKVDEAITIYKKLKSADASLPHGPATLFDLYLFKKDYPAAQAELKVLQQKWPTEVFTQEAATKWAQTKSK
jgi:predicted Zn-dependent protease